MVAKGDILRESILIEISRVSVARFEEAVGWRAGLAWAESAVPLAYLSHVNRKLVDVGRDVRPEPLIPGLGTRGVNGGGSLHPHAQVPIGGRLRSQETIEDQYSKAGGAGSLEFVVVRNALSGPDQSLVADARTWMIYR